MQSQSNPSRIIVKKFPDKNNPQGNLDEVGEDIKTWLTTGDGAGYQLLQVFVVPKQVKPNGEIESEVVAIASL